MSFRDILAHIIDPKADAAVVRLADAVADPNVEVTALQYEVQPDPPYAMEVYSVSEIWTEIVKISHKKFIEDRAELEKLLKQYARTFDRREATIGVSFVNTVAGVQARHADVSIVPRPRDKDDLRNSLLEGALFGSGRPVLVAPPDWKGAAVGKNVVVAWNAKREAARAMADAAPFIDKADRVTIVTVDAEPSFAGHGAAPGADIAAHLARRKVNVELRNLDGLGRQTSEVLIAECTTAGADLLVLGGYGRARLQEFIFGGVTRDLITTADIPLLMSH